jgi:hypothetical protein
MHGTWHRADGSGGAWRGTVYDVWAANSSTWANSQVHAAKCPLLRERIEHEARPPGAGSTDELGSLIVLPARSLANTVIGLNIPSEGQI